MEYSNPEIPEEINYSKENPLKEFLELVLGVGLAVFLLAFAINTTVRSYGHLIPFSWEAKLFTKEITAEFLGNDGAENVEIEAYLAKLAEDLAEKMQLPEEIELQVNWQDSEEINAFATLDGNIIINQGLIEYVESENELAFIIAHEIAHIKERHPIKSLGSAAATGLFFSIVGLGVDNGAAMTTLGTGVAISSLSFSRSQESEADELALQAVFEHYGHTVGADDFFERAQEFEKIPGMLQFVSTHPGMLERIEQIQSQSNSMDSNSIDQELLALPPLLAGDSERN